MTPWHAVLCKPRREALAEENLVRQGYRVFLPRLAVQARRRGRWVDAVEPLFPRYLFAAAGSAAQSLAPVRSTLGVCGLVRFGAEPAVIPEAMVETLRARQASGEGACARRAPFQRGDAVGFGAGPFAGLLGVFEIEAGEARAFVLLELLGKLNKVRVERDWLVPA